MSLNPSNQYFCISGTLGYNRDKILLSLGGGRGVLPVYIRASAHEYTKVNVIKS